MEFMSSEESEQDEEETRTGPSRRHIKLLQWKSTKLRNIKTLLDAMCMYIGTAIIFNFIKHDMCHKVCTLFHMNG